MKEYTAYELASHYKVTPATVYSWVDKGLPNKVIKIKKRYSMRFNINECEAWIQQARQKGMIK